MSACRKSGGEIGGTPLLFFSSELFVLAVQETRLVEVFRKKKSVSRYVSALRSARGRKKLRKTGGCLHSDRMQNPFSTSVNVCDFWGGFNSCLKALIPYCYVHFF